MPTKNDLCGHMLIHFGKTYEKMNELKELFEEKGVPSSSKGGKYMVVHIFESKSSSTESNNTKSPPRKIPTRPTPNPKDITPPQPLIKLHRNIPKRTKL